VGEKKKPKKLIGMINQDRCPRIQRREGGAEKSITVRGGKEVKKKRVEIFEGVYTGRGTEKRKRFRKKKGITDKEQERRNVGKFAKKGG